ncbi:porin family protein [Flavobacterium algicola]|uniref:porin family protein n=1 Tax=Flavobacterium algicola TaxID=556529 RepID=UPI001EFEE88E|nr:porin family protein [Flavobacterium algicola]MCG9793258.1 PorT family protein [Flavobacterium algicola]
MNKHFFLLVFVFLTFINNVIAQNTDMAIGLKAGTNYSSYTPRYIISGIEDVRYDRKFGFYLGGFANFEISDDFKIQPELIFAVQASKFVNENIELTDTNGFSSIVDFESNINESTIIIPIVAQYFVSESFYLEGGPQFGYIINRKEKIIKDPFAAMSGTPTEPLDFDYDKFDFGLTIGIGYKFSEKINLHTRYFSGLIERNNTIKSSVFNLGIECKI